MGVLTFEVSAHLLARTTLYGAGVENLPSIKKKNFWESRKDFIDASAHRPFGHRRNVRSD